MNTPKPLASLSPGLLARKGAARPAMRPQIQPLRQFHEAAARQIEDDLGWNDMGAETQEPCAAASEPSDAAEHQAEIVVLPTVAEPTLSPPVPEVLRQQEQVATRIAGATVKARRSALAEGRRAAFTLRLDSERHLKLRLASVVTNRSAQQLVTEALDRLIEGMSEIEDLSVQVRKRG
ncbi:MAG TPA: hypothetical protein VGE05_12455 [Novosphingobium sp.]